MYDLVGLSMKMPTTKRFLLEAFFWYDCKRLMHSCHFHIASLVPLLSVYTVLARGCLAATLSERLNFSANGLCPDGFFCFANRLCGLPVNTAAPEVGPFYVFE